jgi:hypothetical protein
MPHQGTKLVNSIMHREQDSSPLFSTTANPGMVIHGSAAIKWTTMNIRYGLIKPD